jgi:hypothetical protein
MQAVSREHKDFGQRVVSDEVAVPERQADDERRLTPAQAAAQFQIPEYLVRKACAEGHIEHLRVVNALWISPSAAASFARAWRARGRSGSKP